MAFLNNPVLTPWDVSVPICHQHGSGAQGTHLPASVLLFSAWMQLLSAIHDLMDISTLKRFFLHYLAVQIPASAERPATSMLWDSRLSRCWPHLLRQKMGTSQIPGQDRGTSNYPLLSWVTVLATCCPLPEALWMQCLYLVWKCKISSSCLFLSSCLQH